MTPTNLAFGLLALGVVMVVLTLVGVLSVAWDIARLFRRRKVR